MCLSQRAKFGKEILVSLARQLTEEYGKGWGEKQLRQCMKFAEVFPDEQIVYAVRIQLSWTHLRSIIYIDEPLKERSTSKCAITITSQTFQEIGGCGD